MPLLQLWSSSPDAVGQFTIEQVVATAGDGNLKDGSVCSQEFREYLSHVPTSKLGTYVEQCLASGFSKGGMVLRGLVNELGHRLDYAVTSGRYQGTVSSIGFDGIWLSPEGHAVIVEVKTTDTYRISLDTIATYRRKLIENGQIIGRSSMLIVVGRQDTGDHGRTYPYWYAYHPHWDEYIKEAENGLLVLGCMDLDYAFALPRSVVHTVLDGLNITIRPDGERYWHMHLVEKGGEYSLLLPKRSDALPLTQYIVKA